MTNKIICAIIGGIMTKTKHNPPKIIKGSSGLDVPSDEEFKGMMIEYAVGSMRVFAEMLIILKGLEARGKEKGILI